MTEFEPSGLRQWLAARAQAWRDALCLRLGHRWSVGQRQPSKKFPGGWSQIRTCRRCGNVRIATTTGRPLEVFTSPGRFDVPGDRADARASGNGLGGEGAP